MPTHPGPATLRADGGSLRLGWDVTTAGEPMVGIVFEQVRAYRHRSDGSIHVVSAPGLPLTL